MTTACLLLSLLCAQPVGITWTIVDVDSQQVYKVADAANRLERGGRLIAEPEGAALTLTVDYVPGRPVSRAKVTVRDLSGTDRGLVVRMALELPKAEWRWWQDLDTSEPVGTEQLSNTAGLRGLPGLPFFTEAERPEYGRYSVYPLGVVDDGQGWLSIARPMRPVAIVRFSAEDNGLAQLAADVDLALSAYTKPTRQASFELWVQSGSNADGPPMRRALEGTYEADPKAWEVRTNVFGQWMPFADLAKIQNVDEFDFAFQEGAPNAGFDDQLGARSFVYFHCAGEFANVPGYQRGSKPEPPYSKVIAAFNQVAERNSGVPNAWDLCGIRNADGQIDYRAEKTYGDFFCQACVDPDLPYGQGMIDKLLARVQADEFPKGVDGVYYDGIATGLDYDSKHLAAANHLLLWDAKLKRPLNYNLFSSAEWADAIHDQLDGTGKLTMLNDSSLASFPFVGPAIDVLGGEISINLPRDRMLLVRALTRHKPFCTLVKADYTKVSPSQLESFMRRCVAYSIIPGFFDITPSGDHPGSSYWVHPEWYNRDRPLFRRYLPLARELAVAGWHPDPNAQVTGGAHLERYQQGDGLAYYTLSTDPGGELDKPRNITLDLPGEPLGRCAVELLTGRVESSPSRLSTPLAAEDLAVWAVGTPHQLATAAIARAQDVLDRRARYVAASAARAAGLTPWSSYGDGRNTIDAPGYESQFALKCERAEGQTSAGATQTFYLNQKTPGKLVVSGASRSENVTGEQDREYAIYVDCYYLDGSAIYGRTASFETGTHDWQTATVTIEPEKPIRNVNVYLLLRGKHYGTVWFDEIKVATVEQPDRNLLTRGGFEATGLFALCGSSEQAQAIHRTCAQVSELLKAGPAFDAAAAGRLLAQLEQQAKAAGWGEDTARTLRDAADLSWHLELARACLEAQPRPGARSSRLTDPVALGAAPRQAQAVAVRRYTARSGKVPVGTVVTVDSNYDGYHPEVLTDGRINPADAHWTDVAWASGDGGEHWIELDLPRPTMVEQVTVWWARDEGRLKASGQLELQTPQGDGWQTIAKGQPADGRTTFALDGKPQGKLRLRQAAGGGSADRPNLMWVTEIAVER